MGARYIDIGHGEGHAILFAVAESGDIKHAIVAGYSEWADGTTDPDTGYKAQYQGPGHGLTHRDVFEKELGTDLSGATAQGRICRHSGRASLVPCHGRMDARKLEYIARRIAKQFKVTVEVFQYNNGWLCQVI